LRSYVLLNLCSTCSMNTVLQEVQSHGMSHSAVRAMLRRFDAQPLKRHPPDTREAVEAAAAGIMERHEEMSGQRRSAALAALISLSDSAEPTFSSSRAGRKRKFRSTHDDQQEEAEQKEESASKLPRSSLSPAPCELDVIQIDDGDVPAAGEQREAVEEDQPAVGDAATTSQPHPPNSPRLSAPSRVQH